MTNVLKETASDNFFQIPVKIKRLTETCQLPTRGSEYAAGWDIYADIQEPIVINPHTTVKIGAGFATELPPCVFGTIIPRSGVATKRGLVIQNAFPVIDSDYRGEWVIALHNNTNTPQTVQPQERIAQMVLLPCITPNFIEVNNLEDTTRGSDGFGSSGKF